MKSFMIGIDGEATTDDGSMVDVTGEVSSNGRREGAAE